MQTRWRSSLVSTGESPFSFSEEFFTYVTISLKTVFTCYIYNTTNHFLLTYTYPHVYPIFILSLFNISIYNLFYIYLIPTQ